MSGLRAVVAISPAGGGALAAWGAEGVRAITAPLLLIAGNEDRTVDYATGARAIFDMAVAAPRYLLTFKGAGHAIGLNPVPDAMRQRLWDQDWFEDPVWRKERITAINAHFITAFLDRYVKGDESRAAYLDVPVTESSAGAWPAATPPLAYDAYSPGGGEHHRLEGISAQPCRGTGTSAGASAVGTVTPQPLTEAAPEELGLSPRRLARLSQVMAGEIERRRAAGRGRARRPARAGGLLRVVW